MVHYSTYYDAKRLLFKAIATVCLLQLCYTTQAQCVASFTHSVNDATKTVTFSNTSTGPFTRSWWDYDGGIGLSTATNPVITFANPGYHYVCLWVDKINDPNCYSGKVCDTIFINNTAPCDAEWFYYGDTNGILWYNSTQSTGANLIYTWSFDDGSPDSIVPYPFTGHQFHQKGTHKVCLTVMNILDSSCIDSSCKMITNTGNCSADFFAFRDTLAPNYTLNFYPQYTVPNTVYTWDFGDGSPTSSSGLPIHQYSTPGKYWVCLTVSNTADACSATICDSVDVTGGFVTTGLFASKPQHNSFSIFPNPATNILTIEAEGMDINETFMNVYNGVGQKVTAYQTDRRSNKEIKLDISLLPSGIYMVEIRNGNITETLKFYKLQ
jgi:PKD repeat protein